MDDKAHRVLGAIRGKRRPYTDADVAMACGLSKASVRRRLDVLVRAGLVREKWLNDRGPFYEVEEKPS